MTNFITFNKKLLIICKQENHKTNLCCCIIFIRTTLAKNVWRLFSVLDNQNYDLNSPYREKGVYSAPRQDKGYKESSFSL